MKKFLAIVVLSLFLITPSQADDIRDFEIEGMSIGDSLLNFYSENEIKNLEITIYQNQTDEYIMLSGAKDKSQEYDALAFHVKKDDKQYIIHSLRGYIYYRKNFDECLNKKKEVVNSLNSSFGILKSSEYDYKYVWDLKSIAYISDFDFENGSVRVFCVNWSEFTDKLSAKFRSFSANSDRLTQKTLTEPFSKSKSLI
jgi:hypothetical protein